MMATNMEDIVIKLVLVLEATDIWKDAIKVDVGDEGAHIDWTGSFNEHPHPPGASSSEGFKASTMEGKQIATV